MSSVTSIAQHAEFTQQCYLFRINLQRVKNHHDQQNFQQIKCDAIASLKKMMEIANREATGNGNLRYDFESWLLWNYELNQEYSSLLMNEKVGFSGKYIDELMREIKKEREGNKVNFLVALTEYEHAKGTLERRTVRKHQAKLNGKLSKKNIQEAYKSLELQNKEIDAALKLCTLADKRTFLQQMANKIGEIYESIRDQLRNIRQKAFTLKQVFLHPICSPAESAKNIFHVFCNVRQTGKVAWKWVSENPGKSAILIIGTVGISLAIGAVGGIVGTALYTGTSIFSVTAADFVVGSIVGSSVLAGITLTAVGGKAARESALTASNAVDAEIMSRDYSLQQLNREEEEYRKYARKAMRDQQKRDDMKRRETSSEVLDNPSAKTFSQFEQSTLVNDSDRLADAAQEMQFAHADISRELIATYQEERAINDHLDNVIQHSQRVKQEIEQNKKDTIKAIAKRLVSILNEQDRFDDAVKTLDALKRQDYDELEHFVNQFSVQNNSPEHDVGESPANNTADNIE
ncbi:unnamed protein product [Rotaria socialis]|uniref:Uncharacterized protein n=1 Tax=Rotaria socialis TaxID=392032 RepID=A0A820AZS3_9BILA|nr:unnamed protein product [Rotaria socialis]CAF4191189.1 unnamed protein product [Rotaria socialis]